MIGAIILGIVAGYLGKWLMPGDDHEPQGFIATTLLGLVGALAGFFVFTELLGIGDDKIFDLGGLIGAVIGVMLVLFLYRMVASRREGRGGARPV
ncbi:GlsB/YeaQ/YmgE family stress response membrane protein [Conexibacter sp. JD483]|uniref:GlsB/YeaQ/YmgE family stress response membrane protein n=1 Tax=unclassified Conexibacter TaxID=2627773 RepID=UPI00271C4C7C|nr:MULTISPECIES: GlsB/YeaQ/YmgE family stress response membrane protein [unclassified Conexibacter]MDO8188867.1 GlsB/YeaQ/YmgE family stress response membrane protein [Conexibacter sp. CPCC 205706]MDO8200445.1 GlsB/YeaQ/YmgE family stress response membrane protein [Conexibacter sp. CPCC 205762]MDR9372596.1 GlsB/YeaQ/YmgE family stress response membrane protein [Conexibacter sp. JD483]